MNAYALYPAGKPEWETIVNASSRGKAKSEYWRHVTDAWPDISYTSIRCQKVGGPVTTSEFIRNAKYRGVPNLRCGDRVSVHGSSGVVVGHNSSANFNVEFDSGRYAGHQLSVHPDELIPT